MNISTQVEIGSHDMNVVVAVSQFLVEFFEHEHSCSQSSRILGCEYTSFFNITLR